MSESGDKPGAGEPREAPGAGAAPAEGEGHASAAADERELEEGGAMASLVKRSMGGLTPQGESRDLLRGVQKKIRQRSRGKFYGDGWSTQGTRLNYVLVALVMLVILGVAYFALGPTGVAPR